jgi:hypothetical protein
MCGLRREMSGKWPSIQTVGSLNPLLCTLASQTAQVQTMMNEIFLDLIIQGIITVYLDDILIFTNSLEEHQHISQMVMEHLRKHKLYLRWDKCEFEQMRIEYLGIIILHNCIEMDPVKVAGVTEWLTLTNKKEVQSFLGFANFYRQFIANFSHHV